MKKVDMKKKVPTLTKEMKKVVRMLGISPQFLKKKLAVMKPKKK